MKQFTLYVLVDTSGNPAMRIHQDDLEDPICGDTIPDLLSVAADWADLGSELDFLDELKDEESEFYGFTIERQEIKQFPLSVKELALVEKIRAKEQARRDRQQARFAKGDYISRDEEENSSDDEDDEE
jgi:hypothetical protein